MMKKYLFVCIALVAACGTPKVEEATAEQSKAAEAVKRITTMEDSIYMDVEHFDRRKVQGLFDVYKAYAKAFPTDSLAPEYLMRAAGLCENLGNPGEGVAMYDNLIANYPGFEKLPVCYMNKALLFHQSLKKLGPARQAYEDLIAKYPDDPYAEQAKVLITQLGMSDEELVRMYEAKNDSTTAVGR